jgi:3-phenylpropionate/trans-cinnamate dioxygenase ferredoxin subunit
MYACASKCPHAGARMKEGYVDVQGNLVCPLHKYRFDVKTGRNVSGEGYFLKRYMVMQKEDGIYIKWQG